MSNFVMAITAPIFMGICLTSTETIQVLFGSHWTDAAPVLAIISATSIFMPSAALLGQIILAGGSKGALFYFTLLQTTIGLIRIEPYTK